MATRVQLRVDLDPFVAARFARPVVARVTAAAADRVRRFAPPAKVWVTAQDERVRPTHVDTDGQTIPANLRFRVPRVDGAGVELARAPRDPDLRIENRANCRCDAVDVPGAIARTVQAGPVTVEGTRVHATVSASFHRVVESEFPDFGDGGGGWMKRALDETAAATRARAGRV